MKCFMHNALLGKRLAHTIHNLNVEVDNNISNITTIDSVFDNDTRQLNNNMNQNLVSIGKTWCSSMLENAM